MTTDPRHAQLAILSSLLLAGVAFFHLPVAVWHVAVIVGVACVSQLAFSSFFSLEKIDFTSALITSISLSLLLRTEHPAWLGVAAFLAIASKFLLRFDGRHLFNPANFAITLFLMADIGWASSGQWGTTLWLAALLAFASMGVLVPSRRHDISWGFLSLYAGLHFGRALWLGDPLAIPMHHLQNGALLIFTFFMISDPKTTPSTRTGRLLFAGTCTLIAFYLKFTLYMPLELFYALFVTSCLYFAAKYIKIHFLVRGLYRNVKVNF